MSSQDVSYVTIKSVQNILWADNMITSQLYCLSKSLYYSRQFMIRHQARGLLVYRGNTTHPVSGWRGSNTGRVRKTNVERVCEGKRTRDRPTKTCFMWAEERCYRIITVCQFTVMYSLLNATHVHGYSPTLYLCLLPHQISDEPTAAT